MINTEKIWMNGKLVGHDDANIHVLSHVVHYGSSVFEGIRIYKTENGPAIFRLREHVKRLFDSAKVYRMDIPYSIEEIEQAITDKTKIVSICHASNVLGNINPVYEIGEFLKDKVSEVELSNNIGNSASSLLAKGGLSLEMEKTLSEMTNNNDAPKAKKILAINPEHTLFNKLKSSINTEDFNKLVDVLYNQALLLEGFNVENPAEFIKNLNSLIK